MMSIRSNTTGSTPTGPTTSSPEIRPTLSERELMKIEFYKTYDVMTGVRIAATLSGFFSIMVLLVIYKSRCKSNRQLEDPRLKAAAAAAVAEAEAEERALAAALEAIARLPPKPARGPRRSLCVDVAAEPRLPLAGPRFASVGGDYDSLLAAPMRASGPLRPHRRCSSVTCSSTASSYLERRGSAMIMPCLPPPPSYPRQRTAYDESWDFYHPIDIQVIQPTPELSPCASEAGLYTAPKKRCHCNDEHYHEEDDDNDDDDKEREDNHPGYRYQHQQELRQRQYQQATTAAAYYAREANLRDKGGVPVQRRAPLASMSSVDPPEPDSRSLGSDSTFREPDRAGSENHRQLHHHHHHQQQQQLSVATTVEEGDYPPDTEDEVSGFSTDSSDGTSALATSTPALPRFLRLPPKKKRPPERWDGCAGCVPRRRARAPSAPADCQSCMTISASVEALSGGRPPALTTTTMMTMMTTTTTTITTSSSSSQTSLAASGLGSASAALSADGFSPIELKHRPEPSQQQEQQQQQRRRRRQQQQQLQHQQQQPQNSTTRTSSSPPPPESPSAVWSQETLF